MSLSRLTGAYLGLQLMAPSLFPPRSLECSQGSSYDLSISTSLAQAGRAKPFAVQRRNLLGPTLNLAALDLSRRQLQVCELGHGTDPLLLQLLLASRLAWLGGGLVSHDPFARSGFKFKSKPPTKGPDQLPGQKATSRVHDNASSEIVDASAGPRACAGADHKAPGPAGQTPHEDPPGVLRLAPLRQTTSAGVLFKET